MTETLPAAPAHTALSLLPDPPARPAYPTGDTLRPLLTGDANRDLRTAFRLHDDAKDRQAAHGHAVHATVLHATGAPVLDVFRALVAAELAAPDDTRPWHAARLDTWAAAHGIRGWRRYTDHQGERHIATDRLRLLAEDGDRSRHYVHTATYTHRPLNHWVVDRDTGRTVYRTYSGGIARQWITAHEKDPS
ncbi:hypothetical protein PV405_08875 [Streptomyces sp. ME02-6979-3A]|uniref:hypothetical protein n=1 Tax=Streptomyces sp. ME02-6979-3A TaxID=3028673 RepID=UPI0029A00AD6|nr:hypothetical protein [Streptomyces sp. ME02-6979-3A]MDX3324780.1 hypothetical protein [Streptomyces sp. ME02-6979-3A]